MHSNLKILQKLTTALAIIIIILGFTEQANLVTGNWYVQFFPNLHGASIRSIVFADSLTGYAVTNLDSSNISYILKSSNSGDNWSIARQQSEPYFNKLQFLSRDIGYVGGDSLLKTTNGGLNWFPLNLPASNFSIDFFALNENVIWFADNIPIDGGLFMTTDKGLVFIDCTGLEALQAGPANNDKIVSVKIGIDYQPVGLFPVNGQSVKYQDGGTIADVQLDW